MTIVTLSLSLSLSLGCLENAIAEAATHESAQDREIATVLLEGRVEKMMDIGVGLTQPRRAWLNLDGVALTAAFKSMHLEQLGLTRFENAPPELNFIDSFHYDRAAYLLDRRLGLRMVPVTVRRKIGRDDGALAHWIEDSITETERRERDLAPKGSSRLADQRSLMRLFDALIFNVDRHEANQMITVRDWKLHLIDHTRAFRMVKKLPSTYETRPSMLTRELHRNLESLEEDELVDLLRGEVARGRIQALLVRRDKILQKIEKDLDTYGEVFVYAVERSVGRD